MITISPKAEALILESEGMDQPGRWPGNSSGITIGHGYDLGYTSVAECKADWSRHLPPETLRRLSLACGHRGEAAHRLARQFADITISRAAADEVFRRATLPKWAALCAQAFPGVESLPADAQGALVSLCFNRGTSMDGERRREMRDIRDAVRAHAAGRQTMEATLRRIAAALLSMRRLWPETPGLQRRREREAALVTSALTHA